MKKCLSFLSLVLMTTFAHAQNGLENIIVEKYYVSNAADAAGSIGTLPVGSVTYRIYVDMLPGYKFQAVYGIPGHELRLATTTSFFNNEDRGAVTPTYTKTQAQNNTVMLDSWLSVGGACSGNFGILKSEDDVTAGGATVVNNTVPHILQNADPTAGIPLTVQDGLYAGTPELVTTLGITSEMAIFDATSGIGNLLSTTNGSWASLNGSTGPVPATNKVLIAQMTTDGCFSFELNIQIGTPSGGVQNYVARNPVGNEIQLPSLIFNSININTALLGITSNPAGSICTGTNVTFTATPLNGGSAPSYQWKVNGINTGSNSPTFSSNSLSNGSNVTCVMTSNLTCVSGSPATSNLVTIVKSTSIPSIASFFPLTGTVGTAVYIYGGGFTGTTLVKFNGISTTFTIIGDDQIKAIIPPGAESGSINVINGCGSVFSLSSVKVMGLEKIIVEKYYVSNSADSVASIGNLPVGSVTYRIYADMLPGYKFQAVYGIPGHELRIATSTSFFNNEDRGAITPSYTKTQARTNTVMLDSWISVGAACSGNFGILKADDNGISTVVNSEIPPVLQSTDPSAGIPVSIQDGLIAGTPEPVTTLGITSELAVFDAASGAGNLFSTTNGSWASLNGSVGPTPDNRVLIAQITTDGNFSFELNVQIGTPSGGVQNYVAKNPVGNEIVLPSLTYPSVKLDLNAFIEGYYQPEGLMRSLVYDLWFNSAIGNNTDPTATDTISVGLWRPESLANPGPDYTQQVVLHNNGTAAVSFPSTPLGTYYIAVKHRNTIETWSKLPIIFTSSSVSYSFTSGLSQAYDDGVNPPMKNMGGGVYAFYSGDITQEGTVDILDMTEADNEATAFDFGYIFADCNGDGSSDILDMTLIDNNASLFLFTARPY